MEITTAATTAHNDTSYQPLQEVCGGPLWALNSTSAVTPCFLHTVVTWCSCLPVWILFPAYIMSIKSCRREPTPRGALSMLKTVTVIVLVILVAADIVKSTLEMASTGSQSALITSTIITFTTYLLAGVLLELERRWGLVTSSLQCFFWFGQLVAGGVAVYGYSQGAFFVDQTGEYWSVMRYTQFGLICVMVLLTVPAEQHPADTRIQNTCPEYRSSFISKATFSWMNSVVMTGYRKSLEEEDVWSLDPRDCSSNTGPELEKCLEKTAGKRDRPIPLARVFLRLYGSTLLKSHFCKLVCDCLSFVGPFLQSKLIIFMSDNKAEVWVGYTYALCFFATSLTTAFFFQALYHIGLKLGMRIRSAVIAAIYQKALHLSNDSRRETTTGEIVNLMSVDAQRLQDVTGYLWMVWSSPLQVTVCVWMLWMQLGPSVVAGLVVMIMLIPLNTVIATKQKAVQVTQLKHKDSRIKLMNEILGAMKVLKLNAWEQMYEDKVRTVRDLELDSLRRFSYLAGVGTFSWTIATFLVMLATFTTYTLAGNRMAPDTTFVSLSLFNMLYFPINLLPQILSLIATTSVSVTRIGTFLAKETMKKDSVSSEPTPDPIVVEDGTFAWGRTKDTPPVLKGINVTVERGSFVAVVGRVGAGKSSLLSAFLGDMDKIQGKVNVHGRVAYVAQQAWIQNATLRDNILFGKSFDEVRYQRVLDACYLGPDLETLPGGDHTEIGEKGINLSGGQKQRVSLARAVYSDADIFLLDDPLSAVDAHVSKHIFTELLGDRGLLSKKTRVMVTHGLQWLPSVDTILVLSQGTITQRGTYEQLLAETGPLAELLAEHKAADTGDCSDTESGCEEPTGEEEPEEPEKEIEPGKVTQSGSVPGKTVSIKEAGTGDTREKTADRSKLTDKERSAVGEVKWAVFLTYAKALGKANAFTLIMSYTLYRLASILTNFWLAAWTEDPILLNSSVYINSSDYLTQRDFYLSVYGGYGVLQMFFTLVYALVSARSMVRAAGRLQSGMLKNVLRSPMSFFDTTPSGRILNRFSRDVDTVDSALPALIRQWMNTFFIVVSSFAVLSYAMPLFLAVGVPLAVIYFFIQKFYIPTSRQLKRLESSSRSPIFEHFGESLSGVSTIRAYRHGARFTNKSHELVDQNIVFHFASMSANRWLGMRLDFLSAVIVLSTSIISVSLRLQLNASVVGLVISYALQVTSELNWMVRVTSDLESNVVSVERIKEYTETPTEAAWHVADHKPPSTWPTQGRVTFEKYSTRYRAGLDLVLSEINLDVKDSEKVGIVGRTGAGKSSLTSALFRIIEPAGGRILVDGLDIADLGLYDLRSKVAILPQDPVLFAGSVRSNLDPRGVNEDETLWEALRQVQLAEFVSDTSEGLGYECGENGQNLSLGQRQLMCVGRALLHKQRILVLDEATAAVDVETDAIIQTLIRDQFKDSTVLTIAHRLNTIMDSDRVVVLSEGRVVELGPPQTLLADPSSRFYKMARDAGLI